MHGMRSSKEVMVIPGFPVISFRCQDVEDLESSGFTLERSGNTINLYAPNGYKPEAIPVLRTLLGHLQTYPYPPENVTLLGTCEMEDGRRDLFMVEVTEDGEHFTFPLR